MASWGPPPPPPSHSRSPRRRESYPDVHPPASVASVPAAVPFSVPTYDWDDHRKAWDEYYDRRPIPRSRSPPADEASRKRRRSASPYDRERDRFDPRPRYGDDYDAHSRAHGYTSPRRTGYHTFPPPLPPPGIRRPPVDPYAMEPAPATLRQYAEWFRYYYPSEAKDEDNADRAAEKEAGKRTRDGIRMRWEKYKKQHTANQLQTLFDHHKKSPWFSEKYNPAPEWINLRTRVRKEGWKGRSEQFLKDLEEGKYDPSSEQESTTDKEKEKDKDCDKEPVPEDGKAADEMDGVEDEARENGPPDSPTKSETNGKPPPGQERPRRDDEVLVNPDGLSMAIRTIPPDIGRQKIEEACRSVPGFIHLALGEPLQKKNYYRAGWIKFKESTDMQVALHTVSEKKIEGFKLHVHYVARPFYARMRTAPEVASTLERLEKDLQQAKQLAALLEDEYASLRRVKDGAPEPKLEDGHKKQQQQNGGGDLPMTDGGSTAEAEGADEAEVEVEVEVEPLEKGSDAVERRIGKLVEEMEQPQQPSGDGDADEDGDREMADSGVEAKKTALALDLYAAYLRAAFNTCYYCAAVCDHVEELQRKCPKHVRKPISEKPSAATAPTGDEGGEEKEEGKKEKDKERNDRRWERNDERWQEWMDSKMALLINRPGIDVTDYGGKNYEEELTKAVEPHTKQEDEGKFRCRTCQKLFKATAFVEKHVANKHPELVRQVDELPFFNNFALDPHRIQPFSHMPPAVGGSALPPPQAYGLQGTYGGMMYGAGADYGRPMAGYGAYAAYAAYAANGEYYGGGGGGGGQHWGGGGVGGMRREEPRRRLQERVGGFASTGLPGVEGLPAKPMTSVESQSGGRGRQRGGPPPPPADAKEDPRASGGKRVSYHDMDDVAEGDVELTY